MSSTIRRVLIAPAAFLADSNTRIGHPAERGAWIWHPEKSSKQTAILRFKRRFSLEAPTTLRLHVTGDQRFQLRCDGQDVTFGPDRCDVEHWTVQTVEMHLPEGEHEMEALAWWIAEPEGSGSRCDPQVPGAMNAVTPPMAQMTWRGGFLLFAENLSPSLLNTGEAAWLVEDLTDAVTLQRPEIPDYHDVGPSFSFSLGSWREQPSKPALTVMLPLEPNGYGVRRPGWGLFPADLPEQQREPWTAGRIRALRNHSDETPYCLAETEAPGIAAWQRLLDQKQPATLAPHSKITLLWDLENYYCGYPAIQTEGGEGTLIQCAWAEALYEESNPKAVTSLSTKGNRNDISQKVFIGIEDSWKVGSSPRMETPALWWRCGRYVRIRIETSKSPITMTRLGLTTTGFPLGQAGAWKSSDPQWDRLMSLFERAYRCSGHETWTDTPYYEQMCYVGDTRFNSLANYAWFNDTRLSRRCIELFEWSRRPSGFIAERYPSGWRQESPTFSLIWPLMVHDFAQWCDDAPFTKKMLVGVRCVLTEFDALAGDDGLLHALPGWPFVDWVQEWDNTGCGPGVREGDSSIVNLQWILAHLAAAELEEAHGDPLLAQRHSQLARRIFNSILARYWDEARGILLDTHGSTSASEHAQTFALLTGLLDSKKAQSCLSALRKGNGLAKATIYSSFYVLDALYRHGESDELHRRLDVWRCLPDMGFTSTPEKPEPTRSDAHAWGAHPAWHALASVAGVRPSSPGFRTVRIAPCPGSLKSIQCEVQSPHGPVKVHLNFSHGSAAGTLVLPETLHGEFQWNGTLTSLNPGANQISPA